MSKLAIVYIAADYDRNLFLGTTKDPQIAVLQEMAARRRLLKIVYQESFPTMVEAAKRLKAIRKMRLSRRRRMVERTNPGWEPVLESCFVGLATPTLTHRETCRPTIHRPAGALSRRHSSLPLAPDPAAPP